MPTTLKPEPALKRRIAAHFRWVFHPVSIFIVIQILSVTLISLWVVWFVGRQRDLDLLSQQFRGITLPVDTSSGVSVLVSGIVALVMVLVGSVLLFIWGQRQSSFVLQQRSFVSSVTHELRTPLASIHLAVETLIARDLSQENTKKLLGITMIDIDRLTRLVNQILISSRLDRGLAMFQDDIQIIHIQSRLSEILKTLEHLDAQVKDRVQIECDKDLEIKMSDNAFTLILSNLLENAMKYSPPNSPIKVTVQIDGGMYRFAIEDQGVGFSSKERRKIFKMFYRGATASNLAIKGTGLGLFIVKTSIEQLGGRISAESDGPNRGSTFYIWLPSY